MAGGQFTELTLQQFLDLDLDGLDRSPYFGAHPAPVVVPCQELAETEDLDPVTIILAPGGELLSKTVSVEDTLEEIRFKVGRALGTDPQKLYLLEGTRVLKGGSPLKSMLMDASSRELTAVRMVCRAEPIDYWWHIDNCRYSSFALQLAGPEISRAFVSLGRVEFPEPRGISITMMPFLAGDSSSVPEEYRHYWPLVQSCQLPGSESGKVQYLTIQEKTLSTAENALSAQALPAGLRVEKYQVSMLNGGRFLRHSGSDEAEPSGDVTGGLYMAFSKAESHGIFNVKIKDSKEIAGRHGDLEHVRNLLGKGRLVQQGELLWLTDVTPHEPMPMPEAACTQYFCLHTSSVKHLRAGHHMSKNTLGIEPDLAINPRIVTRKVAASSFYEDD